VQAATLASLSVAGHAGGVSAVGHGSALLASGARADEVHVKTPPPQTQLTGASNVPHVTTKSQRSFAVLQLAPFASS